MSRHTYHVPLLLLQVPPEGKEGLDVPPRAHHQNGDVQDGWGKVEGGREGGREGRGGWALVGLSSSPSSPPSVGAVVEAAGALLLVLEEGPQGLITLLVFLGVLALGGGSLERRSTEREIIVK